jgi:c-di-GMP-binding flagellar brake protein YcgR
MDRTDYSGPERRRSKRIDHPFNVAFRSKENPTLPWNLSLIQDISNGGLRFQHDAQLSADSVWLLKINIGLGEPPVKCEGKVLRCLKRNQSNFYEIGMQFGGLDLQQRGLIDRAVENLALQKKKA